MIKRILILFLLLAGNAFALGLVRYIDNAAPAGGNGQSWATAWDAFSDITGVGAGDTVYVSGGTTTKTYNLGAGFSIPAGTAANRFVLSIGQESGHNGVAILDGTGTGEFELITNNVDYWTVDGRVAGTGYHFRFQGRNLYYNAHDAVVRTGLRFFGLEFRNGSRLYLRRATQVEIAYCLFTEWLQPSGGEQPHIFGPGDGVAQDINDGFGVNSVHHNVMRQYYQRTPAPNGSNGNDYIKEPQSTDIYNNSFIGVLSLSTGQIGGDHQDMVQTAGGDEDLRIYNNYCENSSNYMIYLENFGNNAHIYNNVFNQSDPNLANTQAIAVGNQSGSITYNNHKYFNNTFRGLTGASVAFGGPNATNSSTDCYIQNNIMVSGSAGITIRGSQPNTIVTNNISNATSAYFVNMAAGDFRLTASASGAINQGINPAPARITSIFTTDADGNARVNPWDLGAYEFGAGTGDPVPFINTATINAAGTQVAIVFSEVVQIGAGGPNGWVLNMSGGNITIPNQTPSGTGTTRTYTFGSVRTVGSGETGTIIYTQPVNGIEDTAGGDMMTGTSAPVSNTSTVPTTNAPVFSPVAGSYFGTQNIVMTSSTPGATIRYTTDGSDPTASSTQYTAGATGIPTSISTTYRAKAFSGGALDSSITQAAYEVGTWVTSGTAWKSFPVTSQTGSFTWTFRASMSQAAGDGVIGLSSVLPDGFNDIGPIVQFNTDNTIKARNGANYEALNAFTYVPATTYEIVCTVNITNRTYSVTASQIGGSPVTIGTNYAWRSDSPVAPELDNFGMNALIGSITVSQMSFGTVTGTIPTLTSATIGSSGTNLTLGFSVPVVYGIGGNGGWTISASGGAATLTPSASPTSFTISRSIAIGEAVTVSYVQPGNGVEATTGGGDMLSRSAFGVNNQSTVDLTAPTPNPSTFSIVPTATGTSTITMTATTSSDANSGPVQYFFNETSGNAGGSDSGWQPSPTFTDTGLAAGTQYSYRVRTRDSASTPNMTSFSNSASATTQSVAGAHPAMPFNVARANIVSP